MARLFGTDGIRGTANQAPLTPSSLVRIGRAVGETTIDRGLKPRAIMGRDPRRSGPMVGGALLSGLLAAGIDVTVGGVLPTPAVARLARAGRFGVGVVVSASHNPAADNGVKLFLKNGRKADREFEEQVERRALMESPDGAPTEPGAYRAWPDAAEAYVQDLLEGFPGLDLKGLTVAVDCANGATSETAPGALARLGAKVHAVHASPDGRNINRRCGAMHPRAVARAVRDSGADAGVTFDGDGDRAIFSDEAGRIVDGDGTMAVLARHLLSRRRLPHRTVVATVMSNLGLEQSFSEIGCRLLRTPVGDKHVVAEMANGGFSLGGEQSGHVVVRKGSRLIGDGLETALHLLTAIREEGLPLSELGECFQRFPQVILNVRVGERVPFENLPPVAEAMEEVEQRLGTEGRVVVRYSGTEPLARVMVEGPTASVTRSAAKRIADAIEREIGSTR